MSEQASNPEYKQHFPDAVEDPIKAEYMAYAENPSRELAKQMEVEAGILVKPL